MSHSLGFGYLPFRADFKKRSFWIWISSVGLYLEYILNSNSTVNFGTIMNVHFLSNFCKILYVYFHRMKLYSWIKVDNKINIINHAVKFCWNPWLGKDLLCYFSHGKNMRWKFKNGSLIDWLIRCAASSIFPIIKFICNDIVISLAVTVIFFLTQSNSSDIYFYSNWHHQTYKRR